MINKIFYSDDDLKKYVNSLSDRSTIVNYPREFPCILTDITYRMHNGDFRRFLDLLYRDDVKKLFHQLEDKSNA